uniref:Uncharacterized protein n=1 Tax=Daphnia galeata TaxID=27404 RepID=A0A8J2RSZ8_9CRUS|nr:unnamed protein product [Daphnia galeata]
MSPVPRNSSRQLLNYAQVIRNPTTVFLPRIGSQPRIIRVVKPGDNVIFVSQSADTVTLTRNLCTTLKADTQFWSRLDIKDKTLEPWVYHDIMQRIEDNKAENSSAYVRETGRRRKELEEEDSENERSNSKKRKKQVPKRNADFLKELVEREKKEAEARRLMYEEQKRDDAIAAHIQIIAEQSSKIIELQKSSTEALRSLSAALVQNLAKKKRPYCSEVRYIAKFK